MKEQHNKKLFSLPPQTLKPKFNLYDNTLAPVKASQLQAICQVSELHCYIFLYIFVIFIYDVFIHTIYSLQVLRVAAINNVHYQYPNPF